MKFVVILFTKAEYMLSFINGLSNLRNKHRSSENVLFIKKVALSSCRGSYITCLNVDLAKY